VVQHKDSNRVPYTPPFAHEEKVENNTTQVGLMDERVPLKFVYDKKLRAFLDPCSQQYFELIQR
jgi:hypothetical protein